MYKDTMLLSKIPSQAQAHLGIRFELPLQHSFHLRDSVSANVSLVVE